MVLSWCTVPLKMGIVTAVVLPLYTFTPLPTRASVSFTMLTPFAPISALPERFTAPELVSVIVELFAARASCSSPAAVTRSI